MYLACYAYELVFLVLRFKNNCRKHFVNNFLIVQIKTKTFVISPICSTFAKLIVQKNK